MKLDVEGNEYEVLEHLVHSRALCLVRILSLIEDGHTRDPIYVLTRAHVRTQIDTLSIEYHMSKHDYEWTGHGRKGKPHLSNGAADRFRMSLRSATEAVARTRACNTTIVQMDDESYGTPASAVVGASKRYTPRERLCERN